jgi:hypothetical protein
MASNDWRSVHAEDTNSGHDLSLLPAIPTQGSPFGLRGQGTEGKN